MGRQYGGAAGDCPVTEDLTDRLLRLPMYNTLSEAETMQVIQALHNFTDWI
jgi:dTDP-4-amino-4,6-dideoxygalactose transaminase